jgi:hypothetical protein
LDYKEFGKRFDHIFAGTRHGKYLLFDETISMFKDGGLYIVDEMKLARRP